MIFELAGIDTLEVLKAAGTKWIFLHFRPGLVGGHCIGVDPYYLSHKAEMMGYHPELILAGAFTPLQLFWSRDTSTLPFVDRILKSLAWSVPTRKRSIRNPTRNVEIFFITPSPLYKDS